MKDLVAAKSEVTEEAVETIVKDYVRYDVDEHEVTFTPEFAGLSNRAKVLVYLTSLQGWPFVTKEAVPTEAKPAEVGEQVGIPGGSLRPILKELKDRHLIANKAGAYSVRPSGLEAVRRELEGGKATTLQTGGRRRPKKRTTTVAKDETASPDDRKASEGKRRPRSASREVKAAFEELMEGGFFDDGRTLAQLKKKFHEAAVIIPSTSLPKYLLGAVRGKRLDRKKENVDGKLIYVYRTKK